VVLPLMWSTKDSSALCLFFFWAFRLCCFVDPLYQISLPERVHLHSTTLLLQTPLRLSTMGFALKKPDDAVGSATPTIVIGLFVAFGGVLFG